MSALMRVANALEEAIEARGEARLALPGGRSAVSLMQALSETAIDWSSVVVSLVDERAVDASDAASNAKLVCETLLQNQASVASFVPLFDGISAESSVASLNASVEPLDVAILGMGEDGHFASLFPAAHPVPGLADDRLGYVATEAVGSPKLPRISMTCTHILTAPTVLLLVSSEEKRQKVRLALEGQDPLNPVSYLLSAPHPIHIVWPNGTVATALQGAFQ